MTMEQDQALSETLRDILVSFEREGEAAIARLATLYDPDGGFNDPLHAIRGRADFLPMNRLILNPARPPPFDCHPAAPGEVRHRHRLRNARRRGHVTKRRSRGYALQAGRECRRCRAREAGQQHRPRHEMLARFAPGSDVEQIAADHGVLTPHHER